MDSNLRIEWVNHAGFIISNEHISILCDPWLIGPVFNNGWELLVPTNLSDHDFSKITHIWFSHEHPDHFNPPSLGKILPLMNNPTILFQETKDKRLLNFFNRPGINIKELESMKKYEIMPSTFITVGKNGIEDSWSLFEIEGKKILNLNDCIFTREKEIQSVSRKIGKVDVMLSHFSYAEKVGNLDDDKLRSDKSQYFMELIIKEAKYFSPKFVIPFASFKYFSNRENFYLNTGVATAKKVFNTIKDHISAETVILFPSDIWKYGQQIDCTKSIAKYAEYENRIKPQDYSEEKLTIEQLIQLSDIFINKIKDVHRNSLFLGFPKITMWLDDFNYAVEVRLTAPLKAINTLKKHCDIETSSGNIAYLYRNLFGANCLMVNGRYQATHNGNFKLFVFSHIALMANANVQLTVSYITQNSLKILSNLFIRVVRP